jgi:hypothetical protein
MKKLIQILIILFLIKSCSRSLTKDKTTETAIINDNHKSKEQLNNEVFLYDESNDTVKKNTFFLKSNFKLIVFPTRNEENDNQINFALLGKNIDTIIKYDVISTKKNTAYFDGSDFSNFFAIKQSGGANTKFWLFDKTNHIQSINGLQVKFDLKNELIIYKDDNYNLFLFDCNSRKNIPINIPFNELKKYDCMKYGNIENEIDIKKVSDHFYYFRFNICDSIVSFRIRQ